MRARIRNRQFSFVEKSLVLINIIGIAMAVNMGRMYAAESAPAESAPIHVAEASLDSDTAAAPGVAKELISKAVEKGYIASPDIDLQIVLESDRFADLAQKAYAAAREGDTIATIHGESSN